MAGKTVARKGKLKRMTTQKASARNRTIRHDEVNAEEAGAPFSNHDPKRRLGNFVGAGEHARKGGRTSGIVGQTTKTSRTDKRKKG